MIEAICETIKSAGLSIKDQKKIIRKRDFTNRNVFHFAPTISKSKLNSLHNSLSTILSKDEIKAMLKEEDSHGCNILYSSRKHPFLFLISHVIEFLHEVLTNEEVKDLIQK